MNENLKKAIQLMLYSSDQQLLQDDVDKINFKKDGWWKKYTWTEKREEYFINYIAELLKKNWQGITEKKPTTKKEREAVAREFVSNYGCVIRPLTIEDFTPLIPQGQLEEEMSKNELEKWNRWAMGNTMSIHGVYRWDVESFLRGGRNWD